MERVQVARILVTIPAAFLVVGPPLADLNATHVLNPLWTGHARLHTMWLISTNSLIALLALLLLWRERGKVSRGSVLLSATLVGSVLLGFFFAAATLSLYGGSLSDPNGIPTRILSLDANLFGFGILAIILVASIGLCARPSPQSDPG